MKSFLTGSVGGLGFGVLSGCVIKYFAPFVIIDGFPAPLIALFGAICGGFMGGLWGALIGLIFGIDHVQIYKGTVIGSVSGTLSGFIFSFIAHPANSTEVIFWGMLCGLFVGCIMGLIFRSPLSGFERMSCKRCEQPTLLIGA